MSRKHLLAVLVALCCALTGTALYAQTSFGRISGSVTDPTGAAVPGTTIKIPNTETQNVRTVTTDDSGLYLVTNLPVGPYTLDAAYKSQAKTEAKARIELAGVRLANLINANLK